MVPSEPTSAQESGWTVLVIMSSADPCAAQVGHLHPGVVTGIKHRPHRKPAARVPGKASGRTPDEVRANPAVVDAYLGQRVPVGAQGPEVVGSAPSEDA